MTEPDEDEQELANDIRSERRGKTRSYSNFPHSVGKALNQVLIGVRQGLTINRKDVVRVGVRAGQAVGVKYIRFRFNNSSRSLDILVETEKKSKSINSTVFVRFTTNGNAPENITTGCSYRKELFDVRASDIE